ncbi:helix-turn-helix transcriptional regulator [bacterium]|nr:helix-turn-helix transcriptional regulator [bacterium]
MMLSPKEVKVLSLIALGFSDKEIAIKLKISYGTVRTHLDKTVLKLNARNRSNAILIYKMINKDWLEEFYETYNNTLDGRKLLSDRI